MTALSKASPGDRLHRWAGLGRVWEARGAYEPSWGRGSTKAVDFTDPV